jgi:hypothetical protein
MACVLVHSTLPVSSMSARPRRKYATGPAASPPRPSARRNRLRLRNLSHAKPGRRMGAIAPRTAPVSGLMLSIREPTPTTRVGPPGLSASGPRSSSAADSERRADASSVPDTADASDATVVGAGVLSGRAACGGVVPRHAGPAAVASATASGKLHVRTRLVAMARGIRVSTLSCRTDRGTRAVTGARAKTGAKARPSKSWLFAARPRRALARATPALLMISSRSASSGG